MNASHDESDDGHSHDAPNAARSFDRVVVAKEESWAECAGHVGGTNYPFATSLLPCPWQGRGEAWTGCLCQNGTPGDNLVRATPHSPPRWSGAVA
jgi:hypothetical protein